MDKNQLVAALGQNRDEFLQSFAGLSELEVTTFPVIGEWTVKDLVGHVSYWEQVIHAHVRESYSEGQPRQQLSDETEETVNPRETTKRKNWPWARVLKEFENTRRALIQRVQSLSETDLLFQVPNPWLGETRFYSVGEMIAEDAINHCRDHGQQIAKWRARRHDS